MVKLEERYSFVVVMVVEEMGVIRWSSSLS